MAKAAIYTRISSDPGREGIGVDAQEVACRELAALREYEIFDVYSDDDKGASEHTPISTERKEYARMLADAKDGKFDFIIAYSASRLTRRLEEFADFVKLANPPYNVKVVTKVSGEDDLTTADGLMMARFKAVMDAGESHRISERAKASHKARAQKGLLRRSPWRAFGFEDDGLTHRESEAVLIREAIDLIKAGAALKEVGRMWEQRGVVGSKGRTEWNHSDVKDILFRWKNVGVRSLNDEPQIHPNGEYVRGVWEPIYSVEDREAALSQIITHYYKPHRRSTKSLLSGLLICGKCGRKLYGNQGSPSRQPMYICTDGRKAHLGIAAGPLELHVQRIVFRYVTERAYFGESEPPPVATFSGEDRLKAISVKMEETMAAYNADELAGSVALPMLEAFRVEQAGLIAERTKHYVSQQPKPRAFEDRPHAMQFYRKWREAPVEHRRKLLRTELEGVVIGPGIQGKRAQAQLESRVKIVWPEPHPIFDGRTAEEAVKEPFKDFFARNFPNDNETIPENV